MPGEAENMALPVQHSISSSTVSDAHLNSLGKKSFNIFITVAAERRADYYIRHALVDVA